MNAAVELIMAAEELKQTIVIDTLNRKIKIGELFWYDYSMYATKEGIRKALILYLRFQGRTEMLLTEHLK